MFFVRTSPLQRHSQVSFSCWLNASCEKLYTRFFSESTEEEKQLISGKTAILNRNLERLSNGLEDARAMLQLHAYIEMVEAEKEKHKDQV